MNAVYKVLAHRYPAKMKLSAALLLATNVAVCSAIDSGSRAVRGRKLANNNNHKAQPNKSTSCGYTKTTKTYYFDADEYDITVIPGSGYVPPVNPGAAPGSGGAGEPPIPGAAPFSVDQFRIGPTPVYNTPQMAAGGNSVGFFAGTAKFLIEPAVDAVIEASGSLTLNDGSELSYGGIVDDETEGDFSPKDYPVLGGLGPAFQYVVGGDVNVIFNDPDVTDLNKLRITTISLNKDCVVEI
jgi:hypothetical protein